MMFDSLQAFIEMDGHGLYVWLVYGSAAPLLVFNLLRMRRERRRLLRELKTHQAVLDDATHTT